jgi:hypothetical protein
MVQGPQAEPSTSKRGEIGFRESRNADLLQVPTAQNDLSLPARLAADSEHHIPSPPAPASTPVVDPSAPPPNHSGPLTTLFKHPKQFYNSGIRVSTIIVLTSQSVILLIMIALWVVVIEVIVHSSTITIFIHLPFAAAVVLQLFLLERTSFKLRAERYVALHPGEPMPPTSLHRGRSVDRLPIAPWNRPALPNYAAVLQELNVGTGDVEDNRIAIPPPPAYGVTRGSRLILAGFINEDLQSESRRIQTERGERLSQISQQRMSQAGSHTVSRPMSYVSQISDSEYETRCDLIRARVMEQTLGRLNQQGS